MDHFAIAREDERPSVVRDEFPSEIRLCERSEAIHNFVK